MKNRIFILWLAAPLFGGCGFFNMPLCPECLPATPDTIEVQTVLKDTVFYQTDTLVSDGFIPMDVWISLLDSVGMEYTAKGDSVRVVFIRGKDKIIYRVVVDPQKIEVIRHDTVRINCPIEAESEGEKLPTIDFGADPNPWPIVAFLAAVIAGLFLLTRKKTGPWLN